MFAYNKHDKVRIRKGNRRSTTRGAELKPWDIKYMLKLHLPTTYLLSISIHIFMLACLAASRNQDGLKRYTDR